MSPDPGASAPTGGAGAAWPEKAMTTRRALPSTAAGGRPIRGPPRSALGARRRAVLEHDHAAAVRVRDILRVKRAAPELPTERSRPMLSRRYEPTSRNITKTPAR